LSLLYVANASRVMRWVSSGKLGELVLLVQDHLANCLELKRLGLEANGKSKKGLLTDVLPQAT